MDAGTLLQWIALAGAGALVVTFEGTTATTTLNFTATSTDTTRNYVGWIDIEFTIG